MTLSTALMRTVIALAAGCSISRPDVAETTTVAPSSAPIPAVLTSWSYRFDPLTGNSQDLRQRGLVTDAEIGLGSTRAGLSDAYGGAISFIDQPSIDNAVFTIDAGTTPHVSGNLDTAGPTGIVDLIQIEPTWRGRYLVPGISTREEPRGSSTEVLPSRGSPVKRRCRSSPGLVGCPTPPGVAPPSLVAEAARFAWNLPLRAEALRGVRLQPRPHPVVIDLSVDPR